MLSCYKFYRFVDGSMMINGFWVKPFRFPRHTNFSTLPITFKLPTQSIIKLDHYNHINRVQKAQKMNKLKPQKNTKTPQRNYRIKK